MDKQKQKTPNLNGIYFGHTESHDILKKNIQMKLLTINFAVRVLLSDLEFSKFFKRTHINIHHGLRCTVLYLPQLIISNIYILHVM